MGQRGPQAWSKAKLKIGTVRLRKHSKGGPVRMVKVRDDGPRQFRWMPVARHWWLTHRGPVPAGMRVVHANGDILDDRPENLILATADDVLMLSRDWDPRLDARNRRACRRGASRHNRERARVLRCTRIWPNRWYPVDVSSRQVENAPFRERVQLLRHMGHDPGDLPNGAGWLAIVLGWPCLTDCSACIMHVLDAKCGGGMAHLTGSELLFAVNELRDAYGVPHVKIETIRSELSRVRRMGFAYPLERGLWSISGICQVRRAPGDRRCPMRGAAILGRWPDIRFFPHGNVWMPADKCLSVVSGSTGRMKTRQIS